MTARRARAHLDDAMTAAAAAAAVGAAHGGFPRKKFIVLVCAGGGRLRVVSHRQVRSQTRLTGFADSQL